MFGNRLARSAIRNDVGLYDRVSFTLALDVDSIIRFYDADQFIRHVRWKIDLHAVVEQQSIHLAMGIHEVLFDRA